MRWGVQKPLECATETRRSPVRMVLHWSVVTLKAWVKLTSNQAQPLLIWWRRDLGLGGGGGSKNRRICITLILKTIGNRKGDCAWRCSSWQTPPEKICKSQRTNQCHSLRTLYWFVLCNFQIFSACVCQLEQRHAQSPFLFPIVFSINLSPFFNICSVLAVLSVSPGLFGHDVLLYLGNCAVVTVAVWGFGSWSFGVSLRDGTSNHPSSPMGPNPLSNRSVLHDGRKHTPSSFHNPTPSATKHGVQICRSSLSAAVQTVQVSVEHHLSTALKDRSVVR